MARDTGVEVGVVDEIESGVVHSFPSTENTKQNVPNNGHGPTDSAIGKQ